MAVEEWKSRWLSKPATVSLAIVDVAIILSILAIERLSSRNNGIANVPEEETGRKIYLGSSKVIWTYGLLWKVIPAFLMTLYGLAWKALISAATDRQPFVELAHAKESASDARRTVMLDYRSYVAFGRWIVAFRNRHFMLGTCMLLDLVLSVVLAPLASSLLVSGPTDLLSSTLVHLTSTFDDKSIDVGTDLQAMMNVASAVSIFGAIPPMWSTAQYAFQPFGIQNQTKSGNLTARVPAYSGLLDCQVKTQSEFTATYDGRRSTVSVAGTDRGCNFEKTIFVVSSRTPVYSMGYANVECGAAAYYSRLGLVTASFSNSSATKLADLTVLSCIPSYWRMYGSLTIRVVSGIPTEIIQFQPETNNATQIRPEFYSWVEKTIPSYINYDPSVSIESDNWGRLVYSLASRKRPDRPLDSEIIKHSMETLFAAFFASMARSHAFLPSRNASETDAKLLERVERLLVVSPIAWTIATVMFLVCICNVWLIIYTEGNRSVLYEEPIGLLGSATLLQGSDVCKFIGQVRRPQLPPSDVREKFKKAYPPDTTRCWYDEDLHQILLK